MKRQGVHDDSCVVDGSILFVWHTGEELGLFGSEYFTDHPTVPRDSIVAQLNMDMVGRGDAGDIKGGGPTYVELVGSRRLSTELGDIVEAVNKTEPTPLTFDYTFDANGHPENIYCRSDHYEYARSAWPTSITALSSTNRSRPARTLPAVAIAAPRLRAGWPLCRCSPPTGRSWWRPCLWFECPHL